MQPGFGVEIPQTLDELCDPDRMALVVYDMQVGILHQISQSKQLVARVTQVLSAAREAGADGMAKGRGCHQSEIQFSVRFAAIPACARIDAACE